MDREVRRARDPFGDDADDAPRSPRSRSRGRRRRSRSRSGGRRRSRSRGRNPRDPFAGGARPKVEPFGGGGKVDPFGCSDDDDDGPPAARGPPGEKPESLDVSRDSISGLMGTGGPMAANPYKDKKMMEVEVFAFPSTAERMRKQAQGPEKPIAELLEQAPAVKKYQKRDPFGSYLEECDRQDAKKLKEAQDIFTFRKDGRARPDLAPGEGDLKPNSLQRNKGRPGEWETERRKLEIFEQGGHIDLEQRRPAKLLHLDGFLRGSQKDAEKAHGQGGRAVTGGAMQLVQAGFKVPDACFEDHDREEFMCDKCHHRVGRENFSNEQLMKLSDCKDERRENSRKKGMRAELRDGEEDEGPWKGMMVRLNENGFGFVYTPEIYARHGRDVYLHSRFVQKFLGGARAWKDELEERGWVEGEWGKSRQNFCRVQYMLDVTPEGKLSCRDAIKLELVCKLCEKKIAMRERAEQVAVQKAADAVAESGVSRQSNMLKPVGIRGFDPQAKLTQMIGTARHKLGLPQPGSQHAMPTPGIPGMICGQTSLAVHSQRYSGHDLDLLKKAEVALECKRQKEEPMQRIEPKKVPAIMPAQSL